MVFRRGDTNSDGTGNIADAVNILGFLFSGGAAPSCMKTADLNDDGTVNITDATFMLGYLFGAGRIPTEPFRDCGSDPTRDGLSCLSYTPCTASPRLEENPFTQNAMANFDNLRDRGDKMGFWLGSGFPGDYNSPDKDSHFQGIQRLRAGSHLAVSGSSHSNSHVFIVRLGSRQGGDGRFRSNRIDSNTPPNEDRIVDRIDVSSEFRHAGGIQVIGDYLVVGVEEDGASEVHFYDVSIPTAHRKIPYVIDRPRDPAGAVAITRLWQDDRYLLIVGRKGSNILDVYRSRTTTLEDPDFEFIDTWRESELRSANGQDREFGNYQNLNLVMEYGGQAHLIGLHRNAELTFGRDYADMFTFDLAGDNAVVTKVANMHMTCVDECNYDAGAGLYLDDHGRFMYYSVEHWRDAGWVKFNEFRRDPGSARSKLLAGAWVELYDDVDHEDRSVRIDWARS